MLAAGTRGFVFRQAAKWSVSKRPPTMLLIAPHQELGASGSPESDKPGKHCASQMLPSGVSPCCGNGLSIALCQEQLPALRPQSYRS